MYRIATLIVILKLFPVILAAVQSLESAIPLPSVGKAKLDLVLGIVSDVYGADQSIQKQLAAGSLASLITAMVTRMVSAFNVLGVFQTKAAA